MITKENKLATIFACILSLINSFVIIVVIWSCYRGLDLSDESYYYLGYLFYDYQPNLYPVSFHMIYHQLFSPFNFTIIEIRFLRLFLTIVTALLLFFSIKKRINFTKKQEHIILFNILLSGMLLSYTLAPLTLSYNSMSSILIGLIIGVWILGVSSNKFYHTLIYLFLLGAFFSILFFVKITNLLLLPLLLIATATLYLVNKKSFFKEKTTTFAYLSAFIIGALTILIFISKGGTGAIKSLVTNHLQESFGMLNNDPTHSLPHLLNRYYENAKMVLTRLKYPLLFLILLFTLLRGSWLKFSNANQHIKPILFKIVGLGILTVMIIQNSYWKGGSKMVYTMVIVYLYIIIFALLDQFLDRKKTNPILIITLLLIPICGALGTNNGLSGQVLFYGVFIFFTIYYLVFSSKTAYFKNVISICIVGLCASQVIFATIFHPYRQTKLQESTISLKNNTALSKLLVDNSLLKLSKELAFLKQHDAEYIFAYSAQRGMVLLTDKKPYSLEWFGANASQKICSIINKSNIAPNKIIFLLPEKAPLTDEVLKCFENNGLFFKKDYSLKKQINYYDQYYKKTINLNVYIPYQQS